MHVTGLSLPTPLITLPTASPLESSPINNLAFSQPCVKLPPECDSGFTMSKLFSPDAGLGLGALGTQIITSEHPAMMGARAAARLDNLDAKIIASIATGAAILTTAGIIGVALRDHSITYASRTKNTEALKSILAENQKLAAKFKNKAGSSILVKLTRFRAQEALNALLELGCRRFSDMDLRDLDFSNQNLEGLNVWDSNLEGACFDGAYLKKAVFYRVKLKNASFKNAKAQKSFFDTLNIDNADFENTDFTGAFFFDVKMVNANLKNANFTETQLRNIVFDNCTMYMATFKNVKWIGHTQLKNIELSQLRFSPEDFVLFYSAPYRNSWMLTGKIMCPKLQISLENVSVSISYAKELYDAGMRDLNIFKIKLPTTRPEDITYFRAFDFIKTDVSMTDLIKCMGGADVINSLESPFWASEFNKEQILALIAGGVKNFREVELRDLDLSGLSCPGINLDYATLYNVNLSQANLANAHFTGTNFSNVSMRGANLKGSHWQITEESALSYVVNLDLREAKLDIHEFIEKYARHLVGHRCVYLDPENGIKLGR